MARDGVEVENRSPDIDNGNRKSLCTQSLVDNVPLGLIKGVLVTVMALMTTVLMA